MRGCQGEGIIEVPLEGFQPMQKPFSRYRFSALLLVVMLAACTLHTRITPAPALVLPTATRMAIVLPPTETIAPGVTAAQASPMPRPSVTSTPGPTPQTVATLPITITAQNVNLRQGPGTLYPSLGQLQEGAKVTAYGKARGDDWIYIETGKLSGWVSTAFTSLYQTGQVASLTIKETGSSVVIHGQVSESNGAPLAGVEFAVFQGKESSKPADTRGHSLSDGSFYLYLPPGSSGVWRVSLTGVDCKSPIMDANCNYTGAFMPRFTDITLPDDQVLNFMYLK